MKCIINFKHTVATSLMYFLELWFHLSQTHANDNNTNGIVLLLSAYLVVWMVLQSSVHNPFKAVQRITMTRDWPALKNEHQIMLKNSKNPLYLKSTLHSLNCYVVNVCPQIDIDFLF